MIVGMKEIMELLKASLVSKTPITDVLFPTRSADVKYESNALPRTQTNQSISSDSEKFTVKAFVQKSTNREEFSSCWETSLVLGAYITYIGPYPVWKLKPIRSTQSIHYYWNLKSLLSIFSKYQIFSRNPQPFTPLFKKYDGTRYNISTTRYRKSSEVKLIDPKSQESFVRGPTLFVVTDDLEASAVGSISIVSTLNKMNNIPLSDIEEQELVIGLEVALSLLQASLTSTSALTDGFKPFLQRQPKQEK
ncbi:uncharacterized protein [Henckelia pumila]|uniref:uncharacterized protein n=1 Tax=Henckelia pumila TaxID=405737 RepID=UPI003C6E2E10